MEERTCWNPLSGPQEEVQGGESWGVVQSNPSILNVVVSDGGGHGRRTGAEQVGGLWRFECDMVTTNASIETVS